MPIKKSNTPNKKKRPITTGALPKGKEFQNISFNTKNTKAMKMLIVPNKKPTRAAILMGTLEWLTIPSIAMSKSV